MSRRDNWRKVLDAEVKRWSALSWERLVADLRDGQEYEVEVDGRRYEVEAELLENTDEYIHVAIAVDDGTLPASLRPLTESFIRRKSD